MNKKKKRICLHFHIFKNGGTTVEWILKKNFSNDAIFIDTDNREGILPNRVLLNYLKKNSQVKAFSSHQIRFPLPKVSDFHFIPILFIRHPIDRIFSIYHFNKRRTDSNAPGVLKAKALDVNDYIKWNLKITKHRPMKNFQVLFLSDKKINSPVYKSDFNLAVDRMKSCDVIGVVDRFDESLVIAEEFIRKYFTDIDFSYVKQEITPNRNEDLIIRLENEKSKVESDVMDQITKRNNWDLELFSATNKELERRIKETNNFEKKLTDFQNRCKNKNLLSIQPLAVTDRVMYSQKKKKLYINDDQGTKIILN